jgi:hypothetical protein
LSLLAGGSGSAEAGYAGHHVLTALAAVTVGFAMAGWRRGTRCAAGPVGAGLGWPVVAPLAAWWLVVADHAGFNATAGTGSRAWPTTGNGPRLLRVTWELSGHGFGRGWLLLALLLMALLVDARSLRRGAIAVSEPGEVPSGSAPGVTAGPGLIADQWTAWLPTWRAGAARAAAGAPTAARWATAATTAAYALLAYTIRDVLVLLGAHARQSDESRAAAMARGRLALCALGHERAGAIEVAAPADTVRRRRATRGVALLELAALLAAGCCSRRCWPARSAPPRPWRRSPGRPESSTLAPLGQDELAAFTR